jgi:hypothetical protein
MMRSRPSSIRRPCAALLIAFSLGQAVRLATAAVEPAAPPPQLPRLFPDYAGVVIPPNVAPLNFRIEEPGKRYEVTIRSRAGRPIVLGGGSSSIRIPARPWKELLAANAGEPVCFEVRVQDPQGAWRQFAAVTNRIARETMDGYLVYRLIRPLYNYYSRVGIYQRDLQTFEEWPVVQNQSFDDGCVNCHTFLDHHTETFALHVRAGKNLHPMLLVRSNEVTRVDKAMGYMSWHPSGRLLAYSANKLSLFFHTIGEARDVFDANSDLGIYRVDSNRVVTVPAIALPERNETWPCWSPDGRYLYYCSARKLRVEHFRLIRYDLMRIRYDLEHDQWGQPETLVAAETSGLSAAQPRVSPDGRFLLFCLAQYGHFPIYQPSADLYVMDLATRQYRRLEINSDQADTWHCWSSNSRWVVFSSKRLDGLFARPHFSYMDEQGRFHKPFILPQKDPAFYDSYLKTFNVPEFVRERVPVTSAALGGAVLTPRKILTPQSDTAQEHKEEQNAPPAGEGSSADRPRSE